MRPQGKLVPEGFVATESCPIEDAVGGVKARTYEIQTESRLAYRGLKREQNITTVLEKYAWLYNLDTAKRIEEAYRAETDPGDKAPLRRVYYDLLEGSLGHQAAPIEGERVLFEPS